MIKNEKYRYLNKLRTNLKILIYLPIINLIALFLLWIAIPFVVIDITLIWLVIDLSIIIVAIGTTFLTYSIITIIKLINYDYKKESQHNDLRHYTAIFLTIGSTFIIIFFIFWIIGLILGFKFINKEENDDHKDEKFVENQEIKMEK